MDMDPVGTIEWVVVPMSCHRDVYELPLSIFRVARDVIEGPTWFHLGLTAVREEILQRLSTNQDYAPYPEFFSPQFLIDLRYFLHHPVEARWPWSYPGRDNESSSDQDSSSDDSRPRPDVGRQDQNETVTEIQEQQDTPGQEEDDSASNASLLSFHSAQEYISSNESGGEEECNGTASTQSSNASQATSKFPSGSTSSSDSEASNRHLNFLKATYLISKLQLELVKLQSEFRKFQKVKEKAQKKLRRTTQPERETDGAASPEPQASETQAHQHQAFEPSDPEEQAYDELDSRFGSEEE